MKKVVWANKSNGQLCVTIPQGKTEKIDYSRSHEWMKNKKYINKFINLVNLKTTNYVLDAGCGSGYVSAEIRPKVKDLLQIDHDWAMLSRNNVAKNTETLKADLSNLWMLKDEIFDYIFSRSLFHRLINPQKAYNEFFRLIKPKGKLVVSLSHVPEDLLEEYKKIMSKKGYRLYLTNKQWENFFKYNKKFKIAKKGKIFFELNLNHWGLLKEHENASEKFRKYFKLKKGMIECSHSIFVLEKTK